MCFFSLTLVGVFCVEVDLILVVSQEIKLTTGFDSTEYKFPFRRSQGLDMGFAHILQEHTTTVVLRIPVCLSHLKTALLLHYSVGVKVDISRLLVRVTPDLRITIMVRMLGKGNTQMSQLVVNAPTDVHAMQTCSSHLSVYSSYWTVNGNLDLSRLGHPDALVGRLQSREQKYDLIRKQIVFCCGSS